MKKPELATLKTELIRAIDGGNRFPLKNLLPLKKAQWNRVRTTDVDKCAREGMDSSGGRDEAKPRHSQANH